MPESASRLSSNSSRHTSRLGSNRSPLTAAALRLRSYPRRSRLVPLPVAFLVCSCEFHLPVPSLFVRPSTPTHSHPSTWCGQEPHSCATRATQPSGCSGYPPERTGPLASPPTTYCHLRLSPKGPTCEALLLPSRRASPSCRIRPPQARPTAIQHAPSRDGALVSASCQRVDKPLYWADRETGEPQ